MPITTDTDGSEDVNDFLLRIRDLSQKRDIEDEERTRKLEEEIMQGRMERQARRAERARSISPIKDAPSNLPKSSSILSGIEPTSEHDFSNPQSSRPQLIGSSDLDDMPRKTNGVPPGVNNRGSDSLHQKVPQPPSQPQTFSKPFASAEMTSSRAGTLSWQQRPSSRGSMGSSSRPLSVAASKDDAPKSQPATATHVTTNDDVMSRNQIVQSLGSKDPTWFKQTSDRGLGSAALMRTPDNLSDSAMVTGSPRLSGVSKASTVEAEDRTRLASDAVRSPSPSRELSIRGISGLGDTHSRSESLATARGTQSPLPTLSQRLDPLSGLNPLPGEMSSVTRTLAMSPSQGRLSPEHLDRHALPTKGLGGFVQSAMLKRSDSVNKRWSAQVGPGLSRGNSIASNLSGYEGAKYPMGGNVPLKESSPGSMGPEDSTETVSRPGSSRSNATLARPPVRDDGPINSAPLAGLQHDSFQDEVSEPATVDINPLQASKEYDNEVVMSPPLSPSKRWSPTKASWLENAINKPDSPRVKSPAPQQPAWMAEINRAKQQRGSTESSKGVNFKVSTGGLIRSTPPGAGYRSPGIGGLSSGFSAGVAAEPRTGSIERGGRQIELRKATNDNDNVQATSSPQTPPMKGSALEADPSRQSPVSENPADSLSANTYSSHSDSRKPSPTAAESKPERPPKFDFKSTLKSRQVSVEATSKDEPEFKNVFGSLKRTQTQNYKAPDELKTTLLRGKAGLAVTGGIKKTELKDEFRESILRKKAGMVVPSASTRIMNASSRLQEHNIPEAITKRQGLTKSESLLSNDSMEGVGEPTKGEALAESQHSRNKPKPIRPEKPFRAAPDTDKDLASKGTLGGGFSNSLAGMLRRGPSPMTGSDAAHLSGDSEALRPIVMPNDEEAVSVGPQLTHATKGRARGPRRRLPTASKQYTTKDVPLSQSEPPLKLAATENNPLGFTGVMKPPIVPLSVSKSESRPLSNITHNNNNNNRRTSQPSSPRKPSTSINQPSNVKTSSPISQVHGKELQNEPTPVAKEKPKLSPKPKDVKSLISFTPVLEPSSNTLPKRLATQEPLNSEAERAIGQERREPAPQELDKPTSLLKDAAATWRRAPVKPPIGQDKGAAKKEAGFTSKSHDVEPIGMGIKTTVHGSKPSPDPTLPMLATPSPKSSPKPGKKPASIADRVVSITLSSPAPPQAFQPSQNNPPGASNLFTDVFDEFPSSKTNIGIDAQAVLNSSSSKDSSLKIKTLRRQIFEIADNGKSVPVPSHQEHILFEDSLYICTHVFGSLAGARTTEVYLWCGDGVLSSSIEDAVLFAKKVAKDNNGIFITLKQGKETSNFFQALGGIVITRRGSRKAPESSSGTAATYLLCGRQHVGQIAFDEVDCDPRSLCKGFPHILATCSGNVYLWKGKGSGADELGCARLIGMDLGLTGEIEEVDDGQESDAFWRSFPGEKIDARTAEGTNLGHWHLKPSCEKYTTRLYRVDAEAPRPKSSSGFMQWGRRGSAPAETNATTISQIREITPFAQRDLMDDGVFVLDVFFEIFVILSIRSLAPAPQHRSTESPAFRAALVFAQEYGILAASAEDRPFVPVSSVVVCSRSGSPNVKETEDIPEGMKRAFRKWDDGRGFCECRVLPLATALQVTG